MYYFFHFHVVLSRISFLLCSKQNNVNIGVQSKVNRLNFISILKLFSYLLFQIQILFVILHFERVLPM